MEPGSVEAHRPVESAAAAAPVPAGSFATRTLRDEADVGFGVAPVPDQDSWLFTPAYGARAGFPQAASCRRVWRSTQSRTASRGRRQPASSITSCPMAGNISGSVR